MRYVRYVLPVAILAALALAVPAVAADEPKSRSADRLTDKLIEVRKKTWYWQRVMQRKRTVPHVKGRRLTTVTTTKVERWLSNWRERRKQMRARTLDPPHKQQFLCIHRGEGAWNANTGNGYYGGLQMDMTFQRMYGRWLLRTKGPAHLWKPIEQIWVGERALREGRGFYPWPTTARRCGLI